jgi:hypothetical protein
VLIPLNILKSDPGQACLISEVLQHRKHTSSILQMQSREVIAVYVPNGTGYVNVAQ